MAPFFTSRAAIVVCGNRVYCQASWPFGKITLDSTSLTLYTPLRNFRLSLANIDSIRVRLLGVVVEHHEPGIPPLVSIYGIFLARRLRTAARNLQHAVTFTI